MPDTDDVIYAYFDTNIWFAYLRVNDSGFEKSKELFDDVMAGRKDLIISYFSILEFLDALRRNIARKYDPKHHSESEIRDKIQNYTKCFFQKLQELGNDGHLIFIEYDKTVGAYHAKILEEIQEDSITLTPRGNRYNYTGVGLKDMEHAYHALYAGADVFCTGDRGFEKIAEISDFDGMDFEMPG